MSRYLLLLSLGPVQELIAQARRTRDLWFGSHLLSEISRAAAAALAGQGAHLVFPALDPAVEADKRELEPSPGPLRFSGKPPLAIPNKILCEVPVGLDPRALAKAAVEAAERRWGDFAATVKDRCKDLLAAGSEKAWDEQLHTFLEAGAAWAPIPDDPDGYATTRDALEREISGRKLLRDFPAWEHQRGAVPKSSLDGARETVIAEPEKRPPHLVKRYRITSGEQLDAVGLVKRAGGEPEQFVPIANIALANWMAVARARFAADMDAVAELCQQEGFGRVHRPDLLCGERLFESDAEIFLEDRWAPMLAEAAGEPKDASSTQGLADTARRWRQKSPMKALLDKMNAPHPYVACLVADGDHMGRALDKARSVGEHRAFSARLSHFAERAREIVERDHRGVLVYAGGDDVLAFINVVEALPCAQALRGAFTELVQQALSGMGANVPPPTLSVGIGIGHLLDSLGHLRRLGGDAEKLAKTTRNALGVVMDKRSGGTTELREGWDDDPVALLTSAVSLLQSRALATKKVHEIHQAWSRMPPRCVLLPGEQRAWAELLRGEVERILARSGEGDGLTGAQAGLTWSTVADYDARHAHVERWVSRMLVAKLVAQATGAARPRPKEGR